MATITMPSGNTFDTDLLKAATWFEAGSGTAEVSARPKAELLLVFKDDFHVQVIKGAGASGVYDQLKAAKFPALFHKCQERL
jgi:hypothetical protein